MKKRLLALLLTVVMCLSLGCIPAFAADEDPTYGIYNSEDGSVLVVSSVVTAGEEYPMIAIVRANGNTFAMKAGTFTPDAEGNTFVFTDVGRIDDITGWEVVIRDNSTIVARGPLKEKTEKPPVEPEPDIKVTGVTLDKTTASIKIGETVTLTETVEPSDAANKAVTWSSSNTSVATVSDGVVTGVAEGTATITVTTEDGSKTATCQVTVAADNTPTPPTPPTPPTTDIPVTNLTLDRTSLSLYVGDDSTLIATVSPDDATDPTVTWSSSDTRVATVTDGRVYAVGTGTATITAKAGDREAFCEVTVTRYVDNSPSDRPYRPSTSSGSSSSSATRYRVTVESGITNGKVTVSPTNAAKGATVTITVTPDAGYRLDRITAMDKDSNTVDLTEQNNRYTFMMPDSAVEVSATFEKLEPTTPSTPSQPTTSFTDVAYGAYYYDAVQWAVAQGITNGTGTGTFSPNSPCTRAQIVTFLWRAAGSPVSNGNSQFTDISSSDYYYNAVQWAVAQGITNGTGTATFSPNETCSRAQAVTFLYRYAGSPTASGSSVFADVSASAYYADAVQWAVGNQITNGTSSSTFSPSDICTRGHIVTFLYRDLAA